MSRYRVSIDIGGTFTDFVFFDTLTNEQKEGKALTTPDNLTDSVISGLGVEIKDLSEVAFFVHGTTVGLNSLLQRKGSRVALITTRGFRDVYEIARGNRKEMYNLRFSKPTPLLKRMDIYEVDERILYDGTIEKPLDMNSVIKAAEEINSQRYDSIAICLINAYINPIHETEIENIIRELTDKPVSLSHKIAREWREYERTSTTIINAYIAPTVKEYLKTLEQRMHDNGFKNPIHIMQSGGGVITSSIAKDSPIQTLLSGPVGGALANKYLSDTLGYKNLIGVDMGGTSYDVSMIINGRPDVSTETIFEGFPILTPMVNIYTIGAGGGSIAWVEGGGLRVGPVSAGAQPGPACYDRGGTDPTITDANVVLGRIDVDGFLGGSLRLNRAKATAAVQKVADQINISVNETAEGICKVADAKMADAIRQLTVRKGIDPREFVLVAFGGAGPMHACLTAEELGIETILVPELPGVLSAWGMHQSDLRLDTVRTMKKIVNTIAPEEISEQYRAMIEEIEPMLLEQQIDESKIEYSRVADVRYFGQEYTVQVPLKRGPVTRETLNDLTELFYEIHNQIYGHSNQVEPVEIVNLRLVGIGKLEKTPKHKDETVHTDKPAARKVVKAIFHNREYNTAIYKRSTLKTGQTLSGPAIIEEKTSTTVVPPGYNVTVDPYRNLVIKKGKEGA
ncbi:MAG: hydantoinase/oxoprolinase family protein [Dethiobacteria bacterium]|nr:hydantoinase/oxoprolinase family protein [Dethiobacteria bacterium]